MYSDWVTSHIFILRKMNLKFVTGTRKRVTGGVIPIVGFAIEGVQVIWYRRYTVWPSMRTYYYYIWVHGNKLSLHPIFYQA